MAKRVKRRNRKFRKTYPLAKYGLSSRGIFGVNKIYRFRRTNAGSTTSGFGANTITQTNLGQGVGAWFTLNDLLNATEFTGLFDQYRIDRVTIKLIPMVHMQVLDGTAVAPVNPGMIYHAVDYDDANNPTNAAYMQQYQNTKF